MTTQKGYPADAIRLERLKLRMSQNDLAQRLNVNLTTVSSWERGENKPNYEALVALSDMFGCSLDYLAGRSADN